MTRILVGIPAHGYSSILKTTVSAYLKAAPNCEIFITNSDPYSKIDLPEVIVKEILKENYWTGAVAEIISYALESSHDYLLLVNHDCVPTKDGLTRLVDFAKSKENVIAHALMCYLDNPSRVFWGGNQNRQWGFPIWLYRDQPLESVPSEPYLVSSTMGQCLLLPRSAWQPGLLHLGFFPHYKADSVFSSSLRQRGFSIYLVPKAVVLTDQSDLQKKVDRIQPKSWSDFLFTLFHPVSNRNLKATFLAPFFEQDNKINGCLLGATIAIGKLVKSLLQLIKFCI